MDSEPIDSEYRLFVRLSPLADKIPLRRISYVLKEADWGVSRRNDAMGSIPLDQPQVGHIAAGHRPRAASKYART